MIARSSIRVFISQAVWFLDCDAEMTDAQTPPEPEFLALITDPTRRVLFERVVTHWRDGQGFSLATLNLDHIVKMRQMPDFRNAYLAQNHVVADGNPIVWLSRLAGRPIELMPGSDLIGPLSKLAAENNVPVALLGATQDTLDQAAEHLARSFQGLQVVAKIAPPYGLDPAGDDVAAYLKTIQTSGARLCFLALGAPKQEIFAIRGRQAVPECGFVSIGAGLDFIAGNQTRAPEWVRKLAMEWLWRMFSNPGRLAARYGRCILIMPGLVWQALRARHQRQN